MQQETDFSVRCEVDFCWWAGDGGWWSCGSEAGRDEEREVEEQRDRDMYFLLLGKSSLKMMIE